MHLRQNLTIRVKGQFVWNLITFNLANLEEPTFIIMAKYQVEENQTVSVFRYDLRGTSPCSEQQKVHLLLIFLLGILDILQTNVALV